MGVEAWRREASNVQRKYGKAGVETEAEKGYKTLQLP